MPPPFQRLTVPQFAQVLQAFRFTRRVTAVHLHHTWKPDHAMWRGAASMEGMWRSHTQERRFSDIAQHLTVAPDGGLWTGRGWNLAPASAVGHNGSRLAGPFMIEMVGNFDRGADVLAGDQRKAVLDVIQLVQQHFGLDAETLLFHNQVAAKSCPGSSIERAAFVAEVRAHVPSALAPAVAPRAPAKRGSGKTPMPLPPSAFEDHQVAQRTVALLEAAEQAMRGELGDASPAEELDYSHTAGVTATGSRGLFGGNAPSAAEIDALRPHVINLRMGRFSSDGLMSSSPADVDMILFEHLAQAAQQAVAQGRPLRLLLYAHGGLVKESSGLATALSHVGWWRDNGVYPIHFVWETGLFETLRDLITRAKDGAGGSRGVVSDFITDPLIERGVRALQVPRIWGAMKASAQFASGPGGGAALFVERLAAFCKQFSQQHGNQGGRIELHAAGHSAGSIFMAHVLQAAAAHKVPAFKSLQLMAPAIRCDAFQQLVQPLLPKQIEALTVYTMRRDLERDDHCAQLYRKSLLYLVSAACEPESGTPILGLEESLRADAGLRALFGLAGNAAGAAEVVWSRSAAGSGRSATQSTSHGGFDNDASTMESLARRVLGLDDTAPLAQRFPASAGARAALDPWQDGVDWPAEFTVPPRPMPPASTTQPTPSAPALVSSAALRGRRLALCVGINNYPSAPLKGCVNDAQLWHDTLRQLGFEAELLCDEKARRDNLAAAIEAHFLQARDGDELVLQFAGHGTQAPDLNGDEDGGDSPGLDEALCPQDYADGPLLLDDDLGAWIDRIAPGVRLTLFMDCCHSGDNSRVARPSHAPGARPRGVSLLPGQRSAFVDWHARTASSRRAARKASVATQRATAAKGAIEAAFSACHSRELAWESQGQGEFTLRATRLLKNGGAQLTPDEFYRRVVDDFGAQRRQTPQMKAPADRLAQPLFLL